MRCAAKFVAVQNLRTRALVIGRSTFSRLAAASPASASGAASASGQAEGARLAAKQDIDSRNQLGRRLAGFVHVVKHLDTRRGAPPFALHQEVMRIEQVVDVGRGLHFAAAADHDEALAIDGVDEPVDVRVVRVARAEHHRRTDHEEPRVGRVGGVALEQRLAFGLGCAVRIGGPARLALVEGHIARPEHRHRAVENPAPDTGPMRTSEQRRSRGHVVARVFVVTDAPVAFRGGQVAEEVDAFQGAFVSLGIVEVAAQERGSRRCAPRGRDAVEREDVVAGAHEALDETAPDVPGGAGHCYAHGVLLL